MFKEEVARLSQFGSQDQHDIASLSRKEQFSQNAFLDDLQQSTDYFRYQYFNPLSTEQYYHRLDKQVLALVTGNLVRCQISRKVVISHWLISISKIK